MPRLCANCGTNEAYRTMTVHNPDVLLRHFTCLTIDLLQGLALHLQFHLRIFLEDLRVTLPKHLGYPLVGYTSRTQPCGVG